MLIVVVDFLQCLLEGMKVAIINRRHIPKSAIHSQDVKRLKISRHNKMKTKMIAKPDNGENILIIPHIPKIIQNMLNIFLMLFIIIFFLRNAT